MIIVNSTSKCSISEHPVYVTECPHCNEQFLIYLCPKYICPYCCAIIPDVLGIINTVVIKLRYYFNKNSRAEEKI